MEENNQNINTPAVESSNPPEQQAPVQQNNSKPKPKLKLPILISIIIFSIIVGAGSVAYLFLNSSNKEKACTMEAKICPDGSAVGRTGPNCEFAPCPTPEPIIDPTASWKTYKDEALGFQIRYPSSFEILEKTSEYYLGSLLAPADIIRVVYLWPSTNKEEQIFIQGAIGIDEPDYAWDAKLFAEDYKNLAETPSAITSTKLGGTQAYEIRYEEKIGGKEIYMIFSNGIKDKSAYAITVTASETNSGLINQILSTFRFD